MPTSRGLLADSFSPQKAAALSRTFADRGTAQVPTLVAVRSVWDAQADGMTEQDRRAADRVWDRYREMVRLMRDAGVPILAGTDQAPDGASLHRELELLVEAGLSPLEAIVAATSRPAAFLGLTEELGTVEAGKRADLVLLDGDPLADIANTRRIAAVVVGGSLLDRADLQGLVAGQPVVTPLRLGNRRPRRRVNQHRGRASTRHSRMNHGVPPLESWPPPPAAGALGSEEEGAARESAIPAPGDRYRRGLRIYEKAGSGTTVPATTGQRRALDAYVEAGEVEDAFFQSVDPRRAG